MNIQNIKLPKLRLLLSQLIKKSPNVPRGSEKAFEKIAEKSHRKTVEMLYFTINKAKKNEKITAKKFKEIKYIVANPTPVIKKKGVVKITALNVVKFNKDVAKFYYSRSKYIMDKKPDSIYKAKLRYYTEDGTEVKYHIYNDENTTHNLNILTYLITPWNYTFTKLNKDVITDMLNQTRFITGEYLWHPYAFLIDFPEGYVIYSVEAYPKIGNIKNQMKTIQSYQDNINNTCVYDGCIKFFEIKMNKNEKDKEAKSAYNKLIKFKNQYAIEYTNETLHKIGQLVKANIIIKDFVNGDDKEYNSDEFNKYRIEFMNTRYNHLDLCTASFNDPVELENEEELEHIKNQNKYYIEKYGKVYTSENVYKVKDTEFKTIFKKWSTDVELNKYTISTNSEEYKFLDNYDYVMHRFINDMPIDNNLYKEIDLKKSYYNYSNKEFNPFYVGVPSGSFITCSCNDTFDYKKMSKDIVGFFEVKIVSIKNNKLDKLGFKIGSNYIFYSSMINLLLEHCELNFINACYGPSINIPFTKDFLNEEKGLNHYCKAVGVFQYVNNTIDTNIKVMDEDIRYYSIINNNDCSYYRDDNIIHISRDNMDVQSYRHIALAIHSYNHTLVLNEMLKYNINDIFGIKLDSIVIRKEVDIIENSSFKIKEGKIENLLKNWGAFAEIENKQTTSIKKINELNSYYDMEIITDDINLNDIITAYIKPSINNLIWDDYFLNTNEYVYQSVIVIGGIAGSGKSTSILKKFNPLTTCFTTSCWNLISAMKNKYPDIIGLSIPKLTGMMDGKKVEKCYKPKIKRIVYDEATLLDYKKEIRTIIKLNKHCFHFILGDIDLDGAYYQCSMMNNVINPSQIKCQYVKYTKTYRFDNELNNNLNELREKMKLFKGDIRQLNNWFKQSIFKSRVFNINDIVYNNNDIGISCTNEMRDKSKHLTECFIDKGTKPKFFIKNTYLNKKQYKGMELKEIPDHKNFEMLLFKTIHSFQGNELLNDNKIIIDLSNIFDYNLIYTALSRAKRMDQIYIIDPATVYINDPNRKKIIYEPVKKIKQSIVIEEKIDEVTKPIINYICKCGLCSSNICSCDNCKYEFIRLSGNYFCNNCGKWKDRCIK